MKTFDGSEKRSGEKDMLFVLDTNEYIFGLSELKDTSVKLLDVLPFVEGLKVVVPNTVLDEAIRNLSYIHSILVWSVPSPLINTDRPWSNAFSNLRRNPYSTPIVVDIYHISIFNVTHKCILRMHPNGMRFDFL